MYVLFLPLPLSLSQIRVQVLVDLCFIPDTSMFPPLIYPRCIQKTNNGTGAGFQLGVDLVWVEK
jgi:hypothetical protein